MTDRFPRLAGYCPMGCGETLSVGAGGHITCGYIRCPRPDAAGEILNDPETEHVVRFDEGAFTIRHPLRERLDDALFECQLPNVLAGLRGPPVGVSHYRAYLSDDGVWGMIG